MELITVQELLKMDVRESKTYQAGVSDLNFLLAAAQRDGQKAVFATPASLATVSSITVACMKELVKELEEKGFQAEYVLSTADKTFLHQVAEDEEVAKPTHRLKISWCEPVHNTIYQVFETYQLEDALDSLSYKELRELGTNLTYVMDESLGEQPGKLIGLANSLNLPTDKETLAWLGILGLKQHQLEMERK